ncbi:MAG: hypothetical protein P9L99_04945 [Candidatus Lernaella stagnicola]|nr:hypothetical protein [Candidatus Lernaella stagnicola]
MRTRAAIGLFVCLCFCLVTVAAPAVAAENASEDANVHPFIGLNTAADSSFDETPANQATWAKKKDKKKKGKKGAKGKKSSRKAKGAKHRGPDWCLEPKLGVAIPFTDVYALALELNVARTVLRRDSWRLAVTGSLGYVPLGAGGALGGDDPEISGTWLPVHLGANAVFGYGKVQPYAGAGIGFNYYDFDVIPKNTSLDLDVADDKKEESQNVKGGGFGGRLLGGVGIKAGPGFVDFELQLHAAGVEKSVPISPVIFVGYNFCF